MLEDDGKAALKKAFANLDAAAAGDGDVVATLAALRTTYADCL